MNDAIEFEIASAIALLRNGEAHEAAQMFRQILMHAPDHPDSLHWLGIIAGRNGNEAECVDLLSRAVVSGTSEQRVRSGVALAEVRRKQGSFAEAEAMLRQALKEVPQEPDIWLRLGLVLREAGHGADGLAALNYAAQLAPQSAAICAARAAALLSAGQSEAAAFLCREQLVETDDSVLRNLLGIALKECGDIDAAAQCFERALAARPNFLDARYNLANVRKDQARADEAVGLFREIVKIEPQLAAARFALCMAHLPPLYWDEAEISRRRADYAVELDRLIAHAGQGDPRRLASGVGAAQPFLLAAQGLNDVDLQRRYGDLVCRAMACERRSLAEPPRADERVRLGVVCGHIRDHSVWRVPTRGWMREMDRSRFAITAYHTAGLCDEETARARSLFDNFVQGPLPVDRWRERIANDRPHALLYPEIGMDPVVAQLAAMRLAPAQYVSWGHPSTSGYPTIDFYLSSASMEPDDGDAYYSERLVRLPGLSTPVSVEPFRGRIPERGALGIPEDAIVYWCGQSLHKYLPNNDDVFPAIAKGVPKALFVFVAAPGSCRGTELFKDRLRSVFSNFGQDMEQSCLFLPRFSAGAYRSAIGCADVILDSIGWSGCNTLLDGLSHALPILTLRGKIMRARHGAAILEAIGQENLICTDRATYVRKAIALASDRAARDITRSALNECRGILEGVLPVRELERHIYAAVCVSNGS